MKKDLGKIEKILVRDVWATEPEFTRWLAQKEYMAALGEELGIELVHVETEAGVGDFSLDILAATTEGEKAEQKVIIENQFGTTNHDHLGKVLTYASGHGASYIVWIFENLREEHRQALDWLNAHTTDDVSFFGVKLELWRIGGSLPAPKFDVVCRPNDWAKAAKRQAAQGEPSEGKLRQQEFWEQLRAYATEHQSDLRFRTPQPQHWYDISIGSAEAHISLTMNTTKKLLGCSLYIPDNKELFSCLRKEREAVEKELGAKLEWEDRVGKKACYIIQHLINFDIATEEKYSEYFGWLHERASSFKKSFEHRVQDCR